MKTHPSRCNAYQASDQMICPTCGLGWDVNDVEPPTCPRTEHPGRSSGAPAYTKEDLDAWEHRLTQQLIDIPKALDQRQQVVHTNQQRRIEDPGEFKIGVQPDREHGRRYLDRALAILRAKRDSLDKNNK